MPELPEVECLTKAIRSVALGGRLEKMAFFRKDLRGPIPIKSFKKAMKSGARLISGVTRRSKYMLWEVDEEWYGIFHLGMSGNILLDKSAKPTQKHTHAIFSIVRENQSEPVYLHFVDPRRFGRIAFCKKSDLAQHPLFKELGPEPLKNKALAKHLFEASRAKKQPVKSFLMDARIVVGIGNIYASEALFRSRVNPLKPAGKLTMPQCELLAEEIKATLKEAIQVGGTSFRDFKNADGELGYFANRLCVYGREGEECDICGNLIVIAKLAGRSSFYCPSCQR